MAQVRFPTTWLGVLSAIPCIGTGLCTVRSSYCYTFPTTLPSSRVCVYST